jgi:hypothetical protein
MFVVGVEEKSIEALPVGLASVMMCIVALWGINSLPEEEIQLHDIDSAEESADEGQVRCDPPKFYDLKSRAIIYCLMYSCSRAFVTAGLEAVTVMILQKNLGWSLIRCGFMVSITFLACIPLSWAHSAVGDRISLPSWVRLLNIVAVVGSLLLFPALAFALNCDRTIVLITADAILFPALMLASGMVEGLLTLFALPPGYLLSLDNILLLLCVWIDCVGRFAGPPLARMNVEYQGQTGYAKQQLMVTGVAFLIAEFFLVPAYVKVCLGGKMLNARQPELPSSSSAAIEQA